MKITLRHFLLLLFFTASVINIFGVATDHQMMMRFSKPLIIPLLLLNVLFSSSNIPKTYYLALIFSFLGDVFLMFEGPNYFLSGIGSFLITQISFSIILFPSLKQSNLKNRILGTMLFGSYLFIFLAYMYPELGDFKIPVIIYGLTISIFGFLAFQTWRLNSRYINILTGAAFFIISDSMIALNSFYYHEKVFGYWVMLTYVIAQFLISRFIIQRFPK